MFYKLLEKIDELSSVDFETASGEVIQFVDTCSDFSLIVRQIGTIPESIEHDSTQEKLFSKVSDAVLARVFRDIGLKATVLKERGDSADVQGESIYHGYSFVADAKAFRMSRTAKNQKDFKVSALSGWRKDADYAVLCSPYFQYPSNKSQIFAQAVDNNVCLLSWEHVLFMIENGIKETESCDLSPLWNICGEYANYCTVAEKKNCFIPLIDKTVVGLAGKTVEQFKTFLRREQASIANRAGEEVSYWENEKNRILSFSKEEAIEELIRTKKINERIAQIKRYVAGIQV